MATGDEGPRARSILTDGIAIAALHAAACVFIRMRGFDHVSDDDFARVTISEAFASTPRLDPSGTSWLPFPFWALGSVMMAFGRTLFVARVASIAFASLAAALPYVALRATGAPRRGALAAVTFALFSPWVLWLGAATVPESCAASFTAAAVIAIGHAGPTRPPPSRDAWLCAGAGALVLVACLCRYEPWPVAATLACVLFVRVRRDQSSVRNVLIGATGLAVLGPVIWMTWNAHAHGSFFHFFHRVATFKRRIGAGADDTASALALYPLLLLKMRPEVIAAGALALIAGWRTTARRWFIPLACAGAQIAFLAYGNARDGAPAHHPERALLAPAIILATFAVDVLGEAAPRLLARARGATLIAASLLGVCWFATSSPLIVGPVPGSLPDEDRRAQIARGNELRTAGASQLVVAPCAYEHFALLAAFGAPELADVTAATGGPMSPACPRVSYSGAGRQVEP